LILAIDPGREKCGMAVLNASGGCIVRSIIKRAELAANVIKLANEYKVKTVVIGDTGDSRSAGKELLRLELKANIVFTKEKYSTQEARARYFKENRPRGVLRLVPTGLLFPPVPVDDYAAMILGERYLKG